MIMRENPSGFLWNFRIIKGKLCSYREKYCSDIIIEIKNIRDHSKVHINCLTHAALNFSQEEDKLLYMIKAISWKHPMDLNLKEIYLQIKRY